MSARIRRCRASARIPWSIRPDSPLPCRAGSTTIWSAPRVFGDRGQPRGPRRHAGAGRPSRSAGRRPCRPRRGATSSAVATIASSASSSTSWSSGQLSSMWCQSRSATESWSMNVAQTGPLKWLTWRRPGPGGVARVTSRWPGGTLHARAARPRRRRSSGADALPQPGPQRRPGTAMEPSACW